MELLSGLGKAIRLLIAGDQYVLGIVALTLKVSGTATLLSLCLGIPVGFLLAQARFHGRGFAVSIVNTGMGLPPVVVGLIVSTLLWRSGPFGWLRILYTPIAMIVAQTIICTPFIIGLTMAGLQQVNPRLRLQLLGLGASRRQVVFYLLREARLAIVAAVIVGFGRSISEVGASMMVGGNILGQTRVLTTATMMEVSKGRFELAIAMGVILLALTYSITLVLTWLQQRGEKRR
jgi:tungstate transport system permease protein